MKSYVCIARVPVLLLLAAMAVWAQSTAQISGNVQDASGGAVPGADVKAVQTDTGTVRTVTSGPGGEYVLNSLETGPYRLEVSKQGFASYVQTGIQLAVADSPSIPVVLKVGAVNEQVQVEANAALVETQNSGVSQIMETARILDLPLNGRNPADLVQLAGAAILQSTASSRSFQGVLGGEGYSIAGGQSNDTTYLLDGALHVMAYDNLNMPLPFPDALQEFKLETSALTAQTGMHGGGTITAVTRSGTNAYHGDAFEFLRNTDLDATNPFNAKGPDGKRLGDGLKQNQFGGTLGGPIKRNKIFFFGGYEDTIIHQLPASNIEYVPNAQMLAGNFQAFASPACNAGRQINLTAPFVDNIVPVSLLDPAALKIAATLPSTTNPCGQITFQSAIQQKQYQLVGKGDYHLNDKNSIFLRYIATSLAQTPPFAIIPNILTTTTGGRSNLAQSAAIGDTYLFGSNMVNSFRVSMNRTSINRTDKGFYDAQSVGINSFSYQPDYLQMTMSGGGSFQIGGGTESASTFKTDTYEVADDFTIVKGSHQISFGGREAHWISSSLANVRSTGIFEFVGQSGVPTSTGLGMSDFLTGKMNLLDDAEPNSLFMAQWYTGLYVQDQWKVLSNLTLNVGLRWEPWFPQSINNGDIYQFSMARFLSDTVSKTYPTAPAGLYYPGDPGFPGKSGQTSHIADFEPRVGIAWDPFHDGKMSVRASYGLFYDFANGQFFINSTIAPPFGDEIRLSNPAGGLDNPWSKFPGGDPFPAASNNLSYFPPTAPYLSVQPNMPTTEMHSWNLSVQRQIGSSWLASANYVGNETEHLWTSFQLNPGVFIPGTCTAGQYGLTAPGPCSTLANLPNRRTLSVLNPTIGQYYGYVDVFDPGGTQSYNGLILTGQHRLSKGLVISANFTWSHCIGDYSQEYTTPNVGTGYQMPGNRKYDHGDCQFDRRENLNISTAYTTPTYGNKMLRTTASGWTASLIYRYLSGAALSGTTGTDQLLNGNSGEHLNQVLPNVYGSGFVTGYLNTAAFAQVPVGNNYGNMGVYTLRGPGVPEMDFSIFRTFPIWERLTMQFRGDAFNLPNNFLRGNPSTTFTSPTFGSILSAGNPRILQFAVKFVF